VLGAAYRVLRENLMLQSEQKKRLLNSCPTAVQSGVVAARSTARGLVTDEVGRLRVARPDPASRPGSLRERRVSGMHAALAMAMIVVAMVLTSCGFQLRGQAAIPYKSLFVETPGYSAFANDLERAIRSGSATKIAQNRNDAEAVLKIIGESQDRYILSLSAGGKVREFELRYKVAYRLTDLAGNDLVPPGEISLRRDLTYDDTLVLAKEQEEALLYRDMKTDAVQQLLRRLAAAKHAA
jgi:LPS-assembly lipoprotein